MNELYAMLPPEARSELEKHEQSRTVPRGTNLIEHGVLPDSLVILNSGTVQVSVPCSRCAGLSTGRAGQVFGMRAAVTGELPEIHAICMETCRVTFVPRKRFLDLLKARPEIYFAVARVLSRDLQMADHLLRTSARSSAPRINRPRVV